MASVAQWVIIAAAVILLLRITAHDFRNLKITNVSVLILLALYAVWAVLDGFATLTGDLTAGGILFGIGLVMWLLRTMGAGDVKLSFALGLLIGFAHMLIYAFLLVFSSTIFLLVLLVAKRTAWADGVPGRLREIADSGRVPYAIPMCSAAIPTILLRTYMGF